MRKTATAVEQRCAILVVSSRQLIHTKLLLVFVGLQLAHHTGKQRVDRFLHFVRIALKEKSWAICIQY